MISIKNIKVDDKKKIIIQVIFVAILLLFVVGLSYAAFTFLGGSTDNNTIGTGQISMSYQEPNSIVELNNALPTTDVEGKEQNTYFEFTVTSYVRTNATDNVGVNLPYEINITSQAIDTEYEQLSDEYVKLYLTKVENSIETEVVEPILISELSSSAIVETNNLVYETSNIFNNGRSQVVEVYRLRAWLDETFDSTQSTQYEYRFRVNVNSGNLTPTSNTCFDYEGTTEITITDYNCYAGNTNSLPIVTNVVIPNEINGIPVTKVIGNSFESKGITSFYLLSGTTNILYDYAYTGSVQEFTAFLSGNYEIELWGSKSGTVTNRPNALGGYTKGTIRLNKGEQLYIYVGDTGKNNSGINGGTGGYNGGGTGGRGFSTYVGGGGGGGATDLRITSGTWNDFASLKSRIMVAAGAGGGSANVAYAGYAGGLNGGNGRMHANRYILGGTQTSGYAFGIGRVGAEATTGDSYGAEGRGGGGGGYYGGQAETTTSGISSDASGGGGSSFISGHLGCDAIDETSTSGNIIHTGQANHYSNKVFTNTKMIDGAGYVWTNVRGSLELMPNPVGGTYASGEGHSSSGYAKIKYIGMTLD